MGIYAWRKYRLMQQLQSAERTVLIRAHKLGKAGDIGAKHCCKASVRAICSHNSLAVLTIKWREMRARHLNTHRFMQGKR